MRRFSQSTFSKLCRVVVCSIPLLLSACGGGTASQEGEENNTSSINTNPGSGFSPSAPEDIFDLPNSLPNSFLLGACPAGDALYDLIVSVSSEDLANNADHIAPLHDFDHDGDMDSILLVRYDTIPKTVIFSAKTDDNSPIYPSHVNFAGLDSKIVTGHEYDEYFVCKANAAGDIPVSMGLNLIEGAWQFPPYNNPIFEQWYVPGNSPADPNMPWAAGFPCQGFEGPGGLCGGFPPLPGALAEKPGVHVVAARIEESWPQPTLHCAKEINRILICPVACHCDAEGNSLPFDANCNPNPVDSPCKL
jgi:hypothetical protein